MMQTLLVNDDLSSNRKSNINRIYDSSSSHVYTDENNLIHHAKSANNGSVGSATTKTSISQFEKLVENLNNNPEYKKEIYLNRLIGFYRIGSEIGTGNFSQVRLGLHLLTKEKVAIKILNKIKLDEKTQRLLLREISSMQKLHHPNIIRLYEVIHTQERLFICMEFAPDGELYTRISNDGKINELESRIIFSQIISAVDHMHSCNVIHRDIKAENIFFSSLSPMNVKIGDFGFSIEATIDKQLNTYCGSPPYAAPELFRDDSYIGIYVDIWALGVLLYFIVTGTMPFKADTVGKLKRVILNGDYIIPSSVSNSCQLLIRGILKPVPADRFSIKEIMESAWLDSEKFTEQLEPYQFNPTIDKSFLKSEEIYSMKILENLGITQEYLILSNLNDSSQILLANAKQNTIMNNLINNKTILANVTNSFQSRPSNMYLTPELRQSINGTYRIVFHCVQKILRKENTNESESNNYFKKELSNIINTNNNNNNTTTKLKRTNSNDSTYSYANNSTLNSNGVRNRKIMNRVETIDNDDEESTADSKVPKSLIQTSNTNNNNNNSIFVKANNQSNGNNSNVNNNSIFVKYNANTKPQVLNTQKTDIQIKQTNKDLSNGAANGHNKTNNHHQNNNNNPKANVNKQSSKFCTIL